MVLQSFTAAQIAIALGKTPRAVRQQLRFVAPSIMKVIRGNEAAAWMMDQLPKNLRQQIEDLAHAQNYRNGEALLLSPRQRWQPTIPLKDISEADIQIATKLREALRPWLVQQHERHFKTAEMETRGVEDYRRAFGNRITGRYWRELFTRTIRRDNGFEEWNRLEIYLQDRLKRTAAAETVSAALAGSFAEVEQFTAGCSSPHAPNETERFAIWTLAFEKYAALVRSGDSEKSAARLVRKYLFARASFLAVSRNALLKAFNRKLEAFQAANGDPKSLRDAREDNGARFKLPESDRDALIHRAVFNYLGDIAPAWRDLLNKGFSPEVVSRYRGRAENKSHVPASVMESIGPEVEILTVMHRGRRAFDSIKGHVTRSYDGISSLQCMSGDDFTLNTYFYVPDGNGWFQLTRGQVILFIDFRSLRILGWALEPRRNYSSLTIRSLCTHIFGMYGVPEVLYFERGLWKSASLLKGKTDPFDFTEISQGLREFGIKFIHAIRPRTKAVERIGGMFQDIAESEPGYCGRDERRDAPETLRPQMAEVEARKVHPSKYFYSYEQWNHRIGELVERYNSEIQQGHILDGMSPDQAFEAQISQDKPPMQFCADLRYLLAHDKRRARITLNGVTIQVGKQKFNYRGREISHLVGREVLAWFDPENPETIVVTNPDRTNPICVARSESPNALESLIEPEAGTLGRELARIEGQASYMKARFNVVKTKFALPSRLLLNAARKVELGQEITGQKNSVNNRMTQQRRRSAANKDKARRMDIPTVLVDDDPQSRRALELLGEPTQSELENLSEQNNSGEITYTIKPFEDNP
jgi:hypothetical protein